MTLPSHAASSERRPATEPTLTRTESSLWGRRSGPTVEAMIDLLRSAGFAQFPHELKLELMPRNPMRRDYFERAAFRIASNGHALGHLLVGKNLADLHRRAVALAEACPDITCHPLLWHQADGWDYFVTEFFEGENLETLLHGGRLTANEVLIAAGKIMTALEQTSQPSSTKAAARELEDIFDRVSALPLFDGLDQTLLDRLVFPALYDGVKTETSPRIRWTNGDVIARNILANAHGDVRLVDYEFAACTHFFALDAWRWQTLSILPPEARILPISGSALSEKSWQESLFILCQMVHQYETNGAQISVEAARPAIQRLMALAAKSHPDFRTSTFLRSLRPDIPLSSRPAAVTIAQLFWSEAGNWSEAQSIRLEYAVGIDVPLRFLIQRVQGRLTVRFDPSELPGLLQISALRLHHAQTGKTCLRFDPSTGWSRIQADSGLLRLVDSPILTALSLNDDPRFILPEVDVGESPCDVACDLWLRFSSDLTALPGLLPRSDA